VRERLAYRCYVTLERSSHKHFHKSRPSEEIALSSRAVSDGRINQLTGFTVPVRCGDFLYLDSGIS